ncbi:MAG: hypothetical protein AB1742_01125 [bacterium]
MMEMTVNPASIEGILQQSTQKQGETLIQLMEASRQAEIASTRPLKNITETTQVDLTV